MIGENDKRHRYWDEVKSIPIETKGRIGLEAKETLWRMALQWRE